MIHVKLYHHVFHELEGYWERVYDYRIGSERSEDTTTLDEVLRLFNSWPSWDRVPLVRQAQDEAVYITTTMHPHYPAVIEYRNEGHRSLGVHDIVCLNDHFYLLNDEKDWEVILPDHIGTDGKTLTLERFH